MNTVKSLIAFSALGLGLAACSGGNNNTPQFFQPPKINPTTKYVQIERLSRPAIKEVFEPFVQHQASNAVEPYDKVNDPLYADIPATEDFVRYGSATGPASGPDYGKDIQGIVYPDEYLVDLSKPTGGFLTTELAGAFGGRAPNDDVINAELGVLFGTSISDGSLGVKLDAADNAQNNCLSTEHITTLNPTQATGATFPYLAGPH